jgi:hypothetical protein
VSSRTHDARHGPRLARTVLLALAGVVLVGLVGALLAGAGTASASRLAVTGTDRVASGSAVPTRCSTADVSTAPVFVDDNPTGAMSGVDVTGIPAACAGAQVLVTGRDAASEVVFRAEAEHTGTGAVRVVFDPVVATEVASVQVTIL